VSEAIGLPVLSPLIEGVELEERLADPVGEELAAPGGEGVCALDAEETGEAVVQGETLEVPAPNSAVGLTEELPVMVLEAVLEGEELTVTARTVLVAPAVSVAWVRREGLTLELEVGEFIPVALVTTLADLGPLAEDVELGSVVPVLLVLLQPLAVGSCAVGVRPKDGLTVGELVTLGQPLKLGVAEIEGEGTREGVKEALSVP
jgi:hypothetical protein